MSLVPDLRQSSFYRAHESYANPRLENEGVNYLSYNHLEELKTDSTIVLQDEYADKKIVPGIGTLRRIGIVTEQGYTYDTLVGIPEKPECEIPVIGTTAWTTSLRGHNEHLVRNLMRGGNYVFYVGAEGSYIADQQPERKSPITLANSAAAVLSFSNQIAAELIKDGHSLDPTFRFGLGESRGGMVGVGIDTLAQHFEQDLLFSDEIAPCLPKKFEGLSDVLRLTEQIIREPREIQKLIGSLTLARLRHYPGTLDMRLECVRHQVAIGGALFSGEAGMLAQKRPGGTLKHVTTFEEDFASMSQTWHEIYDNDPHVVISSEPGSHMTLANLQTLKKAIARNKSAQSCANNGNFFTKKNVIDPAVKLISQQHPLDPPDVAA